MILPAVLSPPVGCAGERIEICENSDAAAGARKPSLAYPTPLYLHPVRCYLHFPTPLQNPRRPITYLNSHVPLIREYEFRGIVGLLSRSSARASASACATLALERTRETRTGHALCCTALRR